MTTTMTVMTIVMMMTTTREEISSQTTGLVLATAMDIVSVILFVVFPAQSLELWRFLELCRAFWHCEDGNIFGVSFKLWHTDLEFDLFEKRGVYCSCQSYPFRKHTFMNAVSACIPPECHTWNGAWFISCFASFIILAPWVLRLSPWNSRIMFPDFSTREMNLSCLLLQQTMPTHPCTMATLLLGKCSSLPCTSTETTDTMVRLDTTTTTMMTVVLTKMWRMWC